MRRSILLFPLFVLACVPDYDLGKVEPADGTVAIVSGGNVDPALHARIVGGN